MAGHTQLVDRQSLQATVDGIFKTRFGSGLGGDQVDVRLYTHLVSAFETARWDYVVHERQFIL